MGIKCNDRAIDVLSMDLRGLQRYLSHGKLTDEEWERIKELYSEATYWEMVWILQEFVLARNYVVLCSGALITKEIFERGLGVAKDGSMREDRDPLTYGEFPDWPNDLLKWYSPVVPLIVFRESRHSAFRSEVTLDIWLDMMCGDQYQATDSRDYVFAVLGISDDGDSIVPDYKLSTWGVFCLALSTQTVRNKLSDSADLYNIQHWGGLMGIPKNLASELLERMVLATCKTEPGKFLSGQRMSMRYWPHWYNSRQARDLEVVETEETGNSNST